LSELTLGSVEFPVEAPERLFAFGDLLAEGSAVAGAADRTQAGELPPRPVQLARFLGAFVFERSSLVSEQACLWCDPGVVAGSRRAVSGRGGVEGDGLGGGSGERGGEPVEGVGGLGAVGRCVGLEVGLDRVEAGLVAGAGERDLAPFLQCSLVVGEHEGALEGESLRFVAGERVGVADVSGLEVAGGEREPAVVVELDND
jgi:hypothetical protein